MNHQTGVRSLTSSFLVFCTVRHCFSSNMGFATLAPSMHAILVDEPSLFSTGVLWSGWMDGHRTVLYQIPNLMHCTKIDLPYYSILSTHIFQVTSNVPNFGSPSPAPYLRGSKHVILCALFPDVHTSCDSGHISLPAKLPNADFGNLAHSVRQSVISCRMEVSCTGKEVGWLQGTIRINTHKETNKTNKQTNKGRWR